MEVKILKFLVNIVVKSVLIYMYIALLYISLFKGLMTGYQFPKENELQYETGYLKSYSKTISYGNRGGTKYLTPIIVLTKSQDTPNGESYHCNYDYGINDDKSDCFNARHLPKEYARQFSKIGYYVQPNFLWLKDDRRKLVTLEVNGKIVIDYQTTKQKMQSQRNFTIIMGIFVIILLFVVWFFDKRTIN